MIKDGNSNGASVLGVLYKDVPMSNKRVLVGKRSVAAGGRFGEGRGVKHICRGPTVKAYPAVAVLRGVSLTSGGKGFFNLNSKVGGTHGRCCHRVLDRLKLKLRGGVSMGINSLSNKRHRTVTLLVSAVAPVSFLVLSRRATTLSPGATRLVVRLAKGVMRRGGLAAVVIARGLHCTIRCKGHLLVVRRNKIIVSLGKGRGRRLRMRSVLDGFGRVDVRYKGWVLGGMGGKLVTIV